MPNKKYHARNCLCYFNDNDVSGYANSLSITLNVSDADTSTFSEDADTGIQGPYSWGAQLSGFSSGNGSANLTDLLFALKTAGTKKFLAYLQGNGAGNHYLYGLAYLTGLPLTANRKDAVGFQLSMKGDGILANYASA